MFTTMPAFEQFVPPGLKLPEQRFWTATSLTQAPWYLFTFEVDHQGETMCQTVLVAWETSLCDLLRAIPFDARKAVGRFDPPRSPSSSQWTVRWATAVWSTAPDDPDFGPLIFKFEGEQVSRDTFLAEVEVDSACKELLFSA